MESRFSRRFFIGGSASFGVMAACPVVAKAGAAAAGGELMKLGVLSDIHIDKPGDELYFKRALEFFRQRKVDGVVISGDIADHGTQQQLQITADAWYGAFPDDKGIDGRKVEKLFVYGNHCVADWGKDCIAHDRAKAWREAFHEEFEPIWLKTVKGVPVIGAHWENRKKIGGVRTNEYVVMFDDNEIEEFMRRHGKDFDPSLPLVYTQHGHPKDTCLGPWAWGHDDGRASRALAGFPKAVAFTGHSHHTLTDDRSIWQGAYTSINAASLAGMSHGYPLRENEGGNEFGFRGGDSHPHRMRPQPSDRGRQGMVVSFGRDHLAIERRDFYFGDRLGDDWVVPYPTADSKPFSFAARAARRRAPVFAAGAAVTVEQPAPADEKDFHHIEVTFPAASAVDGCRVTEYEVTAVLVEDDVELVQAQRRMMSPDHYLPPTQLLKEVSFTFAREDLPIRGHYRFEVRALECFGKKGDKVVSPIVAI